MIRKTITQFNRKSQSVIFPFTVIMICGCCWKALKIIIVPEDWLDSSGYEWETRMPGSISWHGSVFIKVTTSMENLEKGNVRYSVRCPGSGDMETTNCISWQFGLKSYGTDIQLASYRFSDLCVPLADSHSQSVSIFCVSNFLFLLGLW